ncbi:hypothetical protein [Arthrobacter gengyunqii]|uniref:SipW-cognate class signal peptide n=1 Tax=Arthrobacter gengyunqii TaxID=2886940 RepID=A0ABS8GJC6_9MICC|nr:hypothetical protein [Arthrobacter gengyunqii]MCC3266556.1 hypothetical protein [Arthrobacter gengyunqii]
MEMNSVKSLRALKATCLILAAVVLGLMTVQGSYALWNAAVPSNAGTIQSADFKILVTQNGSTAEMKTLSQPLNLNLAQIKPSESSYTSISVTNSVNASRAMAVKPTIAVGLATEGFAEYLSVQAAVKPAGLTCEMAPYTGLQNLGEIAQNGTKEICLKATLKANTPISILGKTTSLPVTLTVSQIPA